MKHVVEEATFTVGVQHARLEVTHSDKFQRFVLKKTAPSGGQPLVD